MLKRRAYIIVSLFIGLAAFTTQANAQSKLGRKNLAGFDNKTFHFGFLLSGNQSDFSFKLAEDTTFSTGLYGISNAPQGGFNLALLGAVKLNRHLSLRFVPGLSFQDRGLNYAFANSSGDGVNNVLRRTEAVNLDLPLLLKIRTDRITNFAAYALVGGKYSRDMQSQENVNQQLQSDDILRLQSSNYCADLGAGVDFFLPFFKFSIEIKTELGLINVLIPDDSDYANPIESLKTRSYIVSICFEG